jgi:hypothetical protein
VREAARLQPSEPVMRELARSLDDLDASRAAQPPIGDQPALAPPVEPRPLITLNAAPVQQPQRATLTFDRRTVAAAAGAGAVVMFVVAGLAHSHATDLTKRLSDPNEPDKWGVQQSANDWQTGSNVLVGAGLLLAASGFLAWRF